MPIRGGYGDTHVRPDALFDITDPAAAPPAGSLEVQFRAPVSLSVMLDGMAQAGLDDDLAAWGRGYSDLVARLLTTVQHDCGYSVEPPDTTAPARLELAGIAESAVEGLEQSRWHCHIYIGPTATILSTGERHPIAREAIRRKIRSLAYPAYMRGLRALAEEQLNVEWGQPRPGAQLEIVNPPWHEYLGTDERGVCPSRWERDGELVLADAEHLRLAAESEEQVRKELAAGYTPEPDWLAVRASQERRLAGAPPISWWQQ